MAEVEKQKNAIRELLKKGKHNGILTYKEIMDALSDFEMDQEDRHLISRYYKCVFVGVILDWLRHDMDYDILSDMHKLEYIYEKSLEIQYKNLKEKL